MAAAFTGSALAVEPCRAGTIITRYPSPKSSRISSSDVARDSMCNDALRHVATGGVFHLLAVPKISEAHERQDNPHVAIWAALLHELQVTLSLTEWHLGGLPIGQPANQRQQWRWLVWGPGVLLATGIAPDRLDHADRVVDAVYRLGLVSPRSIHLRHRS